ncbi:hypothetical protein J2794_000187 [Paraburkholderia terricola]|nr:hypothetical protein [Paraburkholderia terricola]
MRLPAPKFAWISGSFGEAGFSSLSNSRWHVRWHTRWHTNTPRSEHRSAQRIESMPAWLSDCFEAMRRVSKRCIVEWI